MAADPNHVAELMKGVGAWNDWRRENPDIRPDLREADLSRADLGGTAPYGANLIGADLEGANLAGATLRGASLSGAKLGAANLTGANLGWTNFSEADLGAAKLGGADFRKADLTGANLFVAHLGGANLTGATLLRANLGMASLDEAYLFGANLNGANLRGANLIESDLGAANLTGADLEGANLRNATIWGAKLGAANLTGANLNGANLRLADLVGARLGAVNFTGANLNEANLRRAKLVGADLTQAALVHTDLTNADLTDCRIYGISAWDLKLEGAKQQNLIITPEGEPAVTVDNIEVAQFIYLMLNNKKIRDVIDTITSKVVLILGRFTDERKAILDALREELRKRDYLPILFDFEVPATRDLTETVLLLARMARFIIADLTDPNSIPHELYAIVPHLAVPVRPLLKSGSPLYPMFKDLLKFDWVLTPYRYEALEALLTALAEKVIIPAEEKVNALQERRRVIEAELTKPP
jgi:uncharacterized protein YjbI with pentapeptide repeats